MSWLTNEDKRAIWSLDKRQFSVSVIAEGLNSRLDHAAYLGRELARAEAALRTGESYVQDWAPGEINAAVPGAELA